MFVGDRMTLNNQMSVMSCSGGLYSQQHFNWENFTTISNIDTTKLFFDYQSATVTLSVDLEAETDGGLKYGSPGTTIPNGALAINLGSKGFQFNTSNMLNEDEWGKLVYYEQGGLGIGWAFSANSYMTRSGLNIPNGLGMYMLGGLLPDVSFQVLGNGTNFNYLNSVPMYNPQVGRDQALLTQMKLTGNVDGTQGYWSVQAANYDNVIALSGRRGGVFKVDDGSTNAPVFNTYNAFGFLAVSYPTSTQTSAQATPNGWNMMLPMYSPSTQDGYMPTGNALSIEPTSFFTKQGLELLTNVSSNPTSPTVPAKLWTDYWKSAQSIIHLEESKPFYIESPLFNIPLSLALIPNITNGLDLLVPITRICNGVYLYIPYTKTSTTDAMYINSNTVSDTSYFTPGMGTLQKWFKPRKVTLTLNMPFIRVDTALQASRFFNYVAVDTDYTTTAPVWIKYFFAPMFNENGSLTNPVNPTTTASLSQIAGASGGVGLEFTYSAREILNRIQQVLNVHQIPTAPGWGVTSLTIGQIIVSCTTAMDVPRLYHNLFALPAFQDSPQGAILAKGGMKMFSRCGHALSGGAPSNFYLDITGIVSQGDRTGTSQGTAHYDYTPVLNLGRGTRNNDYFNTTTGFVFSNNISLKMPSFTNPSDSGGSITVGFTPKPILNMPFSGEFLNNALTGGPALANSLISEGVLTTGNLQSYANGWFNNLNPYSPDYNTIYGEIGAASTQDTLSYLDYKMVDFTHRKIEIWMQVLVPVKIYQGGPFGQ